MTRNKTNKRPEGRANIFDLESRVSTTKLLPLAAIGTTLTLVLSALLLLAGVRPANAQSETVLYNFTGGSDGGNPQSSVTFDQAGNLYETTLQGGTPNLDYPAGAGTVFKLSPNGNGSWNEGVIYGFSGGQYVGPDGALPSGPLIFDSTGNLYGTTQQGGTGGCGYGTVFELSPGPTGWIETIPYSINCNYFLNGILPMNGVIMDPAGNLYVTTPANGPVAGTVFELIRSGDGWSYHSIYEAPTSSGLTMDASGNIYGTTSSANIYGTPTSAVFELSPSGSGGWNATVIHTFTGYPDDGMVALGTPVLDKAGNLYGTTFEGGEYNYGTVYKLSPRGNGQWKEEILYSFTGGNDGANPVAGIVLNAAGTIDGTASAGGSNGLGTVYELKPHGKSPNRFRVLWTFNGTDGANPYGALVFDQAGNLFGTASSGGSSGAGVVFEVGR